MKTQTTLLLCVLILTSALAQADTAAPPLLSMLNAAMQGGTYALPFTHEIETAEKLFSQILADQQGRNIHDQWRQLGWEYKEIALDSRRAVIVREMEGRKTGRGFFVFFLGTNLSGQALMVPHGFKDLLTDEIGAALISEGNFRCAAFNTRPRRVTKDGGVIEQDLAHEPTSYFTAFTKAFARYAPKGEIIQLHGYAKEKRKSSSGRKSDCILSSGTKHPHRDVVFLSDCLGYTFDASSSVYPDQVEELGATTNISGKILRKMGHGGFIHIEMSRPLRDTLHTKKRFRKKFMQCAAFLE